MPAGPAPAAAAAPRPLTKLIIGSDRPLARQLADVRRARRRPLRRRGAGARDRRPLGVEHADPGAHRRRPPRQYLLRRLDGQGRGGWHPPQDDRLRPEHPQLPAHRRPRRAKLRRSARQATRRRLAGGYFDIVLRGMLSAHGLDASDYQMFSIANPRARVPAIKANQVAGALIGGPDDSLALAEGFNSLGYVHETIPNLDYSGYAVEDAWARGHESLVVGFLRGTPRRSPGCATPPTATRPSAFTATSPNYRPSSSTSCTSRWSSSRCSRSPCAPT